MESFATSVVLLFLVFVCATNAYNPDVDNHYHLFTRRNPTVSQPLLRNNADILAASNYDPRLRTVVSIHGWNGNVIDDYNLVLIPAILASDDVNLIVVDWHIGSLVPDVMASGRSVAQFISWLKFFTGRPAEEFHIIGFSLGAHHAGVTGRYVDGGVGYITALDPASTRFDSESRFQADDALYTEVIYTNAGEGGIAYVGNLGHVNFYPNGGLNMPGCNFDIGCNHFRSYFYLAEALQHGGFTGTECASYEDAITGNCNLPGRLQMGSRLPHIGVQGTYFLRTNAGPPFSIY